MNLETFCSVICFTAAIVCQIGIKAHNAETFNRVANKVTKYVGTRIERIVERNI